MANKTEIKDLLDYLLNGFPYIDSMQIVKDTEQTDVYKIVFSETPLEYIVRKDDIPRICDFLYENYGREYIKIKDLEKFTYKTIKILQTFLKTTY